jgi:hypothetical protein
MVVRLVMRPPLGMVVEVEVLEQTALTLLWLAVVAVGIQKR